MKIIGSAAFFAAMVLPQLFLSGWNGEAHAAGPSTRCVVAQAVGPATILRGGASQPLRQGMAVQEDDQMVTGDEARLRIVCDDGVSLVIGESSSISLSRFAQPAPDGDWIAVIELIEGILRSSLSAGSGWDGFEVRTQTAIAAVRSTEWIVEAVPPSAEPASTAVFVVDGVVRVMGRTAEGEVTLEPGFGTDVPLGGAPTEPKRWGAARVESALSRTRLP